MRKLSYDPKELKKLYKKGLNDSEIAQELECNPNAVQTYRKKHNLPSNFLYKSKYENILEEIKLLKNNGLGNRKISKLLGIPRTSLMYLFRKYNLKNIEYVPKYANLNHFQKSALIGTLLGDGSISKKFIFNIGHSTKQEEYYKSKIALFSPNITFLEYKRKKEDKRTGNTYYSLQAYSHKFEDIAMLRNIYYKKGIKEISRTVLKNFNEISLAYLYMDDGNKSKQNVVTIGLCGFSQKSLIIFQKFILNKWNIESSILKSKSIYIKANSRKLFFHLIKPYITSSMLYKI